MQQSIGRHGWEPVLPIRVRFLHKAGEIEIGKVFDPADQVFTHVDVDGITARHFHVPTLVAMLAANSNEWDLKTIPIDRKLMRFIQASRGIDEAHARRIDMRRLGEPGIGCMMDDGSMLLVDGNHRLVKRVLRGLRTMDAWLCPETVWKCSLLDMPHGLGI